MQPSPSIRPVTHLTTYLRSLGGMQSLVQHHLTHDAGSGFDGHYVSFFERHDPAPDRVDALGWSGWTTIHQMRQAAAAVFRQRSSGTAVYHSCWGVLFLADLDGSHRRLGYLHGIPPDMEAILTAQEGLLDGIIAVSEPLADLATRCLPKLGPGRICMVPLPINPRARECQHTPLEGRPIRIGYSGRLVKAIKRVDRLPELVQRLSASGLDFRLELLGDGIDGPWLRKQFTGNEKVIFHGTKGGDAYWNILGNWDVQINTSDSEGTPVSLLEGLCCGVLPLFPEIDSGGVAYAKWVDPSLVYRPGDMQAAAQILIQLKRTSAATMDLWREKSRQAVRNHTPEAYQSVFRSFIEKIDALPRISKTSFGRRPFYLTDHLPLGLLSRFLPESLLRK